MVYDLGEFPECPFCGSTPILHTDGSTFVELVCMCEGSPCTIDLLAIWRAHLAEEIKLKRAIDWAQQNRAFSREVNEWNCATVSGE